MGFRTRSLLYPLTGIFLLIFLTVPVLILRRKTVSNPPAAAGHARSKGPDGAPVLIQEYSDFQCPSCQTIQSLLASLMDRYGEKVRLEFHHFPLPAHAQAPMAHQAAECAAEQGSFWPYHDKLYENQMVWTTALKPLDFLLDYAREAGLDFERFARCFESAEISEIIKADLVAGKVAGVTSTPTFFIQGRMLVGSKQFADEADQWIQKELSRKLEP